MDRIKPYTSLQAALDLFFEDYAERKQLARSSRRNYQSPVTNFSNWCKANGITDPQVRHITDENVRGYLKASSGQADRTYNQYFMYFRLLCDWFKSEGYVTDNPFTKLAPRKTNNPKYKKAFLAEDRVGEFVALAAKRHPRDQALFVFAVEAGRRQSELSALVIDDVDFTVTPKYKYGCYTATERKKSGKRIRMPLTETTRKILEWWLEEYRELAVEQYILRPGKSLPGTWKVFPPFRHGSPPKYNPRKKHLNPTGEMTTIGHITRAIAEEMGIEEPGLGSHMLRRVAAMMVYREGGLRAARVLLGHEQEKTTAGYIDQDEEELYLIDVLDRIKGSAKNESEEGAITHGGTNVLPFRRRGA